MKALSTLVALATALLTVPGTSSQGGQAPRRAGIVRILGATPGNPGTLDAFAASDGAALGGAFQIDQLQVLPIDFVGRVELLGFAPDRPRFLADIPGASRLALPNGQGMLYHHSRQVGSQTHFGYVWVRPDGALRLLAERRGTGLGGTQDPFLQRIAVAPDGRSFLTATCIPAHGDLYEVQLASGAIKNRTSSLPPLDLLDAGLWLHEAWGFAVASTGVYRFERAGTSQAQLVPFQAGEGASYVSGQAMVSGNRDWAIFTAGDGPTALYAYLFGRNGPSRRASPTPAPLSGAGFLPESAAGPYLAVSDDGQNCAWRIEGVARECFLARVESAGSGGVQISGDQYYLDTLDEIGQMFFFDITKLSVVVGAANPGFGPEKADLFQVALDANLSPQFENRTLSSGDALAPFLTPGTIDFTLTQRAPQGNATFIYDGNDQRILAVPDGQAPHVVLDQVKDFYFSDANQDWVVFAARREFNPRPREIYRIASDLQGQASVLVPGQADYSYPAAYLGQDGWLGYQLLVADTTQSIERVQVATGLHQTFPSTATAFGDTIGFTSAGTMLVREGPDVGPSQFWLWPVNGAPIALQPTPSVGSFLPGR